MSKMSITEERKHFFDVLGRQNNYSTLLLLLYKDFKQVSMYWHKIASQLYLPFFKRSSPNFVRHRGTKTQIYTITGYSNYLQEKKLQKQHVKIKSVIWIKSRRKYTHTYGTCEHSQARLYNSMVFIQNFSLSLISLKWTLFFNKRNILYGNMVWLLTLKKTMKYFQRNN